MCRSLTARADPEAHVVHVSAEIPWFFYVWKQYLWHTETEWLEMGWALGTDRWGSNVCVLLRVSIILCEHVCVINGTDPTCQQQGQISRAPAGICCPLTCSRHRRLASSGERESGQTAGEGRPDMLIPRPPVWCLSGVKDMADTLACVFKLTTYVLAALIYTTIFSNRWQQQIFGIDLRKKVMKTLVMDLGS